MSIKNNVLIGVAAVAALSAGFWLSSLQHTAERNAAAENDDKLAQARENFSPIQGAIMSPARKIILPELIKDNGETFTSDDLTGHWSLLFFGYTNCPDICPVTMGVVAQAKKSAEAINHMFPDVVFVSVDPERDKAEILTDYVQYFDKDFKGVTGDKDLIKALTLQMSVVYMEMPADDVTGNYMVDHSAALFLIDPQGKLTAFFNPPHDTETILKDFQTVVNNSH